MAFVQSLPPWRVGARGAALACCAIGLAACGGGGGGEAAPVTTQATLTAPGAESATGNLVTAVPPATYQPGSDARAAYDLLNSRRAQCGFGLLAQSRGLDQAASAHLDYMVANRIQTHSEDPANPGFTGATPKARAIAAGYSAGGVGEIMAGSSFLLPPGDFVTEMLLDVPYHAAVAFEPLRDVGIAYGSGFIVIDPGVQTGGSLQSAPGVHTYPCDGVTGVHPSVSGEEPSPFPGDAYGTQWGPTISVVGSAVQVAKASVTGPGGSVAIRAILGDGATRDPNGFCQGKNACVIPSPLAAGAQYQVHIEGTDSGKPFTSDFSFATAEF